jgi:hypothetical protein
MSGSDAPDLIALLNKASITIDMLRTMTSAQLTLVMQEAVPQFVAAVQKEVGSQTSTETPSAFAEVTSRGQFRIALSDAIGPESKLTRTWRDDFKQCMDAGMEKAGQTYEQIPHFETLETFIKAVREGVHCGGLQLLLECGFNEEEAVIVEAIKAAPIAAEIGRTLARRDDRYAALIHAGYNVLSERATRAVAPKCFWFVKDQAHGQGLANNDPRWSSILEEDETGFRGFTSYAPLEFAEAHSLTYSAQGMRLRHSPGVWYTVGSDVVCIESTAPEDDQGMIHSAVLIAKGSWRTFMLPPFTLLTVVRVEEAGEWEYLPGKHMQQRCITVRPTYMTPVKQGISIAPNKFATNHQYLNYGNSGYRSRDLSEITGERSLTMEQEWARDYEWTDCWTQEKCASVKEWAYVSGPAKEQGARDAGHNGWTVDRFVQEVNAAIQARAQALQASQQKSVPSSALSLTRAEVIAIRLYTGSAYHPINSFLREVSKLGDEWRKRLLSSPQFTFACTVHHLSSGLRKLARVNTNFDSVFRGVQGELPEAFWLRDAFGKVTAFDFGFMSTSLDRAVSVSFLRGPGKCVLWQLECTEETDDGFHSAADISMLSQYPAEREMLFPPLTMLTVNAEDEGSRTSGTTANCAEYVLIRALPTFQ